jgi:hypothetical protein
LRATVLLRDRVYTFLGPSYRWWIHAVNKDSKP